MTAILTDPHLRQCIADIVKQAKVSCVIETGTCHGESTLEFAKLPVEKVVTIEKNEFNFQIAGQNLEMAIFCGKVQLVWCDSAEFFQKMQLRPDIAKAGAGPDLFVLDAHWETDWPLLEELRGINRIRDAGGKVVVLIDDFFVPDCPQFAGCYGGLKSDDSKGREADLIPCGYNPPFAEELDKFEFFYYPQYESGGIGYAIASDFELELGENFRRVRWGND